MEKRPIVLIAAVLPWLTAGLSTDRRLRAALGLGGLVACGLALMPRHDGPPIQDPTDPPATTTWSRAACVETLLHNVCPNCGGGFAPRPIRPATEWRDGLSLAKRPAGTRRRGLSFTLDEVKAFSEGIRAIPPAER